MGASEFWVVAEGSTAKKAFEAATDEARHESGHGGYTGTIAEKSSFLLLSVPAGEEPEAYAAKIAERESRGYGDKWGPALCVALAPGKYLFFGLASS